MTAPTTSVTNVKNSYSNVQSEFVAVVLAATVGTRLFPLTDSTGIPKHLLPVAGVSTLQRLLIQLQRSGFTEAVVAISQEDHQTIEFLKQLINDEKSSDASDNKKISSWKELTQSEADAATGRKATGSSGRTGPSPPPGAGNSSPPSSKPDFSAASVCFHVEIAGKLVVTVVRLGEDCEGSVGAICQIDSTGIIAPKSHIVVLPGDLVLLENAAPDDKTQPVLTDLVHSHRLAQTISTTVNNAKAACTILLSDVGEQDENGVPLKESAKQKKGGLAREEDDIEYIALSYLRSQNQNAQMGTSPRVVWKQSKMEAEEDKDMVGATPKLDLPKPRLRLGETIKIRTDWSDVHVYVFSPWVRHLMRARNTVDDPDQPASLISLADDLLPLLISRQFLSIQQTFGSKMESLQVEELLKSLESNSSMGFSTLSSPAMALDSTLSPSKGESSPTLAKTNTGLSPYSVLAHVQSAAYRCSTVPAYIFTSKEMVAKATAIQEGGGAAEFLALSPGSNVRLKFQTVVLPNSKVGDKVTFKSTVVGRNCTLGNKCRLNNVILLDDVTLGDNVSLQNTIVGKGVTLGNNCSLHDCQVAPNKSIPAGTKAKNEAFTNDSDEILGH